VRSSLAADPVPIRSGSAVFPNLFQSVLLLVFIVFTTVAVGAALSLLGIHARISNQLWLLLVLLLGEGVGVLAGLKLARWPLRRVFGTLGFSSTTLRRLLVIAFGNLLAVGGLLFVLTLLFGTPDDAFLLDLFTLRSPVQFLALFLTVAIVAPLLEEVLVRGILLRGLVASWGVTAGVLWSALFFAAIHLHPLQAAPAFVNGVVWALVIIRTGSLGATLFLHSLNNALVFLLAQVAARVPPDMEARLAAGSTMPFAIRLGLALLVTLIGLRIVLRAVQCLPRAPRRLTRFWALYEAPVQDVAVEQRAAVG
jgi:membrane protease YdiL (CAAX protease family)